MRTLFSAVRSLTYAAGFIFLWSWVAWTLQPLLDLRHYWRSRLYSGAWLICSLFSMRSQL